MAGKPQRSPQAAPPPPTDAARTRVMAQIAYRVGVARVAKGWTYSQLAARAGGGVRGPMVEAIEGETKEPQIVTLIRLAKALDIRSLDALMGPMPIDDLDPDA